ncbi:MAG TPA: PilZ domain-containing protein [Candidatus Competibacteraceae bacterium]|nr:PilZ domain-containing protein [Candidatus Competibacteraceae bacterium]
MEEEGWIIDNSLSDEERRAYERYSANFYLCIHEQQSGELLGHIIDISLGGLKLLHQEPLATDIDQPLRVRLAAALENGLHTNIDLTVRVVWSGMDDNGVDYNTGVQFTELTSQAQQALQMIIEELGG